MVIVCKIKNHRIAVVFKYHVSLSAIVQPYSV